MFLFFGNNILRKYKLKNVYSTEIKAFFRRISFIKLRTNLSSYFEYGYSLGDESYTKKCGMCVSYFVS